MVNKVYHRRIPAMEEAAVERHEYLLSVAFTCI